MLGTLNTAADGRTVGPEPRPAVNAELLDVKGVARLLSCSQRHVYRLADAGKMPPPIRLGALVRWNKSLLVEWLNAGCPVVRRIGGAR